MRKREEEPSGALSHKRVIGLGASTQTQTQTQTAVAVGRCIAGVLIPAPKDTKMTPDRAPLLP